MNRFERGRSPAAVLAKELDLRGEVGALERPKQQADERIYGRGENEVHHRCRHKALEHGAAGSALAEHEVDEQSAERVEDRHHGDREERRVAAKASTWGRRTNAERAMPARPTCSASRRLAVAADPVAGDGQDERGEAELAESRRVDDEAGEEPGDGADDRPAEERDADERHEQHLRDAAEHVYLREDRDLSDGGDEQQRRGLEAVGDAHGFARGCLGTSAATASSESMFASGCTCTVRKLAMSLVPTATTRPIGMPYGYSSG